MDPSDIIKKIKRIEITSKNLVENIASAIKSSKTTEKDKVKESK